MTTSTTPTGESRIQDFISQRDLVAVLAFLKSYQQLGSLARTFMLKEHSLMLVRLRNGEDQFASYPQKEKDFVEVLVYVELLERLCLIIEDLAKLLHALQFDLERFLRSILTDKNPQNILKEINEPKWHTILCYAPINTLPISGDDKLFLSEIRRKNMERLNIVITLCLDFLKLYWPFFLKHKHGNTILYGLGSAIVNEEQSFMLPAVFNQKHPDKIKGVLVSASIYEKWQLFLNGLVQMTQWIVERTIVFIERGGEHFAEYQTYFSLQQEEREQLEGIVKLCDAGIKRINVIVNINATMEPEFLQKFTDFYKKFDSSLIQK